MRRRKFIAGLGGAVVWPLAAGAQHPGRMRRIRVMLPFDETDPEVNVWFSGFMQGLSELGWTEGRNLRMDIRWAGNDLDRFRCSRRSWSPCNPMRFTQTRLRQSRLYLRESPTRSALLDPSGRFAEVIVQRSRPKLTTTDCLQAPVRKISRQVHRENR
jgi:hypothetical protein